MKRNFFVDTNTILGYLLHQYPRIDILIHSPEHKFFYTETVQRELRKRENLLKNYGKIDEHFKFVNSCLSDDTKKKTLDSFYVSWAEIKEPKPNICENDLLMVMEASVVRCDSLSIIEPEFITTNYQFYKKFIMRERPKQTLETAGMERLIKTVFLDEVL
jgi:hypothetical protein